MSQISRKRMEDIIRGGGSVMVDGRIIDSIGDLPSEVELAKGDEAATQSVRESILATKAEAERQLAEIDNAPANSGAGAKKKDDGASDGEGDGTTVIDLESLTIAKLTELAESRGIPLAPGHKKAEIIEAIRAAKEPE